MDIKADLNSNMIGDFNPPLTSMDSSSIQKVNMKIMVLNISLENISLCLIILLFEKFKAQMFP